jgi:hypothetical protein
MIKKPSVVLSTAIELALTAASDLQGFQTPLRTKKAAATAKA